MVVVVDDDATSMTEEIGFYQSKVVNWFRVCTVYAVSVRCSIKIVYLQHLWILFIYF